MVGRSKVEKRPRMDFAERTAKYVVEAVEPESTMIFRLIQSDGEYDFDLEYQDGGRAAVEVTASMDLTMERFLAARSDQSKGGPMIDLVRCKKGWLLHPEANASLRELRRKADDLLADIEATGIDSFYSATDAAENPAVRRIWRELRIQGGTVFSWKKPHIHISIPSGGGLIDASGFHAAIEAEASKEDNRRKLGASGSDERHLFVYFDPMNYHAWACLHSLELSPPGIAHAPDEITHLWAVGSARASDHHVVWRAQRGQGWVCLGEVAVSMQG